jgi:hypothetical protein
MADPYVQIGVDLDIRDFAAVTAEAVKTLANEFEATSRQNMAASGLRRYASRSFARANHIGGGNWEVSFFLRPSFLRVYEYGGESVGKPMLWFPVNTGVLRGVRASKWGGKLFRPPGTNVLLGRVQQLGPKATARIQMRGGTVPQGRYIVRYIGVPRISFTPRLDLRAIAEHEASNFLALLQG